MPAIALCDRQTMLPRPSLCERPCDERSVLCGDEQLAASNRKPASGRVFPRLVLGGELHGEDAGVACDVDVTGGNHRRIFERTVRGKCPQHGPGGRVVGAQLASGDGIDDAVRDRGLALVGSVGCLPRTAQVGAEGDQVGRRRLLVRRQGISQYHKTSLPIPRPPLSQAGV